MKYIKAIGYGLLTALGWFTAFFYFVYLMRDLGGDCFLTVTENGKTTCLPVISFFPIEWHIYILMLGFVIGAIGVVMGFKVGLEKA